MNKVKLYGFTATRSTTFIVAARDWREAWKVAREWANEALDDAYPDTDLDDEGEAGPDSWLVKEHADDLPYSAPDVNPDELTVKEILEDQEAHPPPDERKGPVVYCDRCRYERVQWDWRNDEQVCRLCAKEEVAA